MADIDTTIDVHCVDDFLATMPEVLGRVALCQRLARRLTTKRGRLSFWPNFGFDVREALLAKSSAQWVSTQAEAECLKDEQVETVTVTAVQVDAESVLTVAVVDADGPFEFTLTITEAAATLSNLTAA